MSKNPASHPATDQHASGTHVEDAGAFDIRRFIGALIGLFGLLLVIMGVAFTSPEAMDKTGGVNANLWAGLVMVAVAIAFEVWAKVDPIRILVQENEPGAEEPKDLSPAD